MAYHGPYIVDFGCTTTSVLYADGSAFAGQNSIAVTIGDAMTATGSKFNYDIPTAKRPITAAAVSYCVPVTNEIVGPTSVSSSTLTPT